MWIKRPVDDDCVVVCVEGDRPNPLLILKVAENLADLFVALMAIKVDP